MDELAARKLAHNEALFREVNERIHEIRGDGSVRETNYICECADAVCFDTIPLANGAYERLRSDKQWFVVVPGHEREGSLEQVIERWPGYVIVEKLVSVPDVTAGA